MSETPTVPRPSPADVDFAVDHADRMLMAGHLRPESMFVQLAAEVQYLRAELRQAERSEEEPPLNDYTTWRRYRAVPVEES